MLLYLVEFDNGQTCVTLKLCERYDEARQLVRDLQEWDRDHHQLQIIDFSEYTPMPTSQSQIVVEEEEEELSSVASSEQTTESIFEPTYELTESYGPYVITGLDTQKFYAWHFQLEQPV